VITQEQKNSQTKVEKILSQQEEVISYTSAIGDGLPKFYFTVQPGIQSNDYAQILIEVEFKKGNRIQQQ